MKINKNLLLCTLLQLTPGVLFGYNSTHLEFFKKTGSCEGCNLENADLSAIIGQLQKKGKKISLPHTSL